MGIPVIEKISELNTLNICKNRNACLHGWGDGPHPQWRERPRAVGQGRCHSELLHSASGLAGTSTYRNLKNGQKCFFWGSLEKCISTWAQRSRNKENKNKNHRWGFLIFLKWLLVFFASPNATYTLILDTNESICIQFAQKSFSKECRVHNK